MLKLLKRKKKKQKTGTQRRNINKIRKLVCCVLAVCVTGIPAVFLNTVYGYLPVLMVLLSFAGSWGYLQLLRKQLVFEELSDLSNCIRGTEVDFTVRLANKSKLIIYPRLEPYFYISDLFGADDTVTSQTITLAPGEERTFDFSVRFDHIGSYSAGLKKIVIHDILGLFTYTYINPSQYQVNVAPRIFDVERVRISDTALTESQKMVVPTVVDGSDYAGVREYVWGDPIKTIHWKLSARTDNYMTKQFESYGTVGISIILDFFSPEYDGDTMMSVFDGIVETGLSVGSYAEENGIEYEIVYSNRQKETKRFNNGKYTDFAEVIKDMPKISATEGRYTGYDLLQEEGGSRYSHGNIAFCTANITEDNMNLLAELRNRRKNPILFAIVPDVMSEAERDAFIKPLRILDGADISYYILASAQELGGGEKK